MEKSKNIIIFGGGVMGLRFAKILEKKNCLITFYKYSKRQKMPKEFSVTTTLKNLSSYDAGFICTPTATHKNYLEKCINAKIDIFIEKPISDSIKGLKSVLAKKLPNQVVMVGFNLRKLLGIIKIKEVLPSLGKIHYVDLKVGQFLPNWRPGIAYQSFYSAEYDKGGGVALDLVHELDFALELFPDLKLENILSKKLSSLDINVEDFVEYHFTNPQTRISLDYLSHIKTRNYHIVGENGSLYCDTVKGILELEFKNGSQKRFVSPKLYNREDSFESEVDEFLAQVGTRSKLEYNERALGIDALRFALKARKKYV